MGSCWRVVQFPNALLNAQVIVKMDYGMGMLSVFHEANIYIFTLLFAR